MPLQSDRAAPRPPGDEQMPAAAGAVRAPGPCADRSSSAVSRSAVARRSCSLSVSRCRRSAIVARSCSRSRVSASRLEDRHAACGRRRFAAVSQGVFRVYRFVPVPDPAGGEAGTPDRVRSRRSQRRRPVPARPRFSACDGARDRRFANAGGFGGRSKGISHDPHRSVRLFRDARGEHPIVAAARARMQIGHRSPHQRCCPGQWRSRRWE